MRVLITAAECAPFVKVGGLADVAGSLPDAIARLGHEVRVVVPHHGVIDDDRFGITLHDQFEMMWNGETTSVEISSVRREPVETYFVRGWPYFAAEEDFVYSSDEGIDVGRFLFFAAALLQWIQREGQSSGWSPDVIHLNDWHTGLIPYMMREVYGDDPLIGQMASLFSIHNMQYQGWGIGWHIEQAGLPPVGHPLLQVMGKHDNALAAGLAYSTGLSTVSPTYADELLTEEGSFGLAGLMDARRARLKGILNGIDDVRWNPKESSGLVRIFDAEDLADRRENKAALQRELGLDVDQSLVVVSAVTRLVDQKGPWLIVEGMRAVLSLDDRVQFVLLGSGQPEHEAAVLSLSDDFPDRVIVRLGFDEALSERIYASSDLFVMPSLFEPCGIGQMLAMRYGALPVVRAVGGLVDSVPGDVGFVFKDYSIGSFVGALNEAILVFREDPQDFEDRQRKAMSIDFSWRHSAGQYVTLYEELGEVHRHYSLT